MVQQYLHFYTAFLHRNESLTSGYTFPSKKEFFCWSKRHHLTMPDMRLSLVALQRGAWVLFEFGRGATGLFKTRSLFDLQRVSIFLFKFGCNWSSESTGPDVVERGIEGWGGGLSLPARIECSPGHDMHCTQVAIRLALECVTLPRSLWQSWRAMVVKLSFPPAAGLWVASAFENPGPDAERIFLNESSTVVPFDEYQSISRPYRFEEVVFGIIKVENLDFSLNSTRSHNAFGARHNEPKNPQQSHITGHVKGYHLRSKPNISSIILSKSIIRNPFCSIVKFSFRGCPNRRNPL